MAAEKTLVIAILILFGSGYFNCIQAQEEIAEVAEEGPSTANLAPFDPAGGVLFDSCFPSKPKRIFKRCHITVIDSAQKGAKEKIEVTFNTKGQPAELVLFRPANSKDTCEKIVCAYSGTLFHSMYKLSRSKNHKSFYSRYSSADGSYRIETVWEPAWNLNDTTAAPDSRSYVFRNRNGRDSCIRSFAKGGEVTSILSNVVVIDDTVEVLTYKMALNYPEKKTGPDDSITHNTVKTYNPRGQLVQLELRSRSGSNRVIFGYDPKGRLISYQRCFARGYGEYKETVAFTIERNASGYPQKVHYKSGNQNTVYLFEWQ